MTSPKNSSWRGRGASAAVILWALSIYHLFYSVDPFRQKLAYVAISVSFCVLWLLTKVRRSFGGSLSYLWIALLASVGALVVSIHTLAAVGIVALLFSAWTLGNRFMQWIDLPERPRLTQAIHALAAGLAFCSLGIFGLGLAHALYAPVLWAVLMVLAASGIRDCRLPEIKSSGRTAIRILQRLDAFGWITLLVVTAFFGIFLVGDLAPPLLSDDLTYHLALPRIFSEAGRVFPVAFYTHFNAPLGAEMLYTAGMVLGSEYAFAGLVNMIYSVVLLGAFLVVSQRLGIGLLAGLWAWLVLFSVFFYTLVSSGGSADLKFLLYVLLAIDSFLWWRATKLDRAWMLCAAEIGFSLHYRYHGVILFAGIFAAMLWVLVSEKKMRTLGAPVFGFLGVVALTGCPWLLRNWIETGNPLFPTSTHFFDGYRGDQEMSELWREYGDPSSPWLFGSYGFGTGWYNYFSLPWRLTFLAGGFEGYELTPLFLAFSPLVLWFAWKDRMIRFFVGFSVFYATAWFFQMHQLKFLIPAFASWALAVAASAASWIREGGTSRRALWVALFLGPVFCTLSVILVYGRTELGIKLMTAFEPGRRDDYLKKHLPSYPMLDYIDKNVPRNSIVFAPDEQSLFYLQTPHIIGWSNNQLVVDYRTMPTFADLLARLKELGVTHLLLRPEQLPGANVLVGSPHAALVLLRRAMDYSHLTELHRENNLVVFKINYPHDLLPYDPSRHADRVAMGDVLMEYGMLNRALDQYRKAGLAGAKKRAAIDSMSHQAKGEYYLSKAGVWKETIFLKPAIDEFAAAKAVARSDDARAAADAGFKSVRETGGKLAGHIWNRLPETKWLITRYGVR